MGSELLAEKKLASSGQLSAFSNFVISRNGETRNLFNSKFQIVIASLPMKSEGEAISWKIKHKPINPEIASLSPLARNDTVYLHGSNSNTVPTWIFHRDKVSVHLHLRQVLPQSLPWKSFLQLKCMLCQQCSTFRERCGR